MTLLSGNDLSSPVLIKTFPIISFKYYVNVEIIIHSICVAAECMSVEAVIQSIVSIDEGTNIKKETVFRRKGRTQDNDLRKCPNLEHPVLLMRACQSIAIARKVLLLEFSLRRCCGAVV